MAFFIKHCIYLKHTIMKLTKKLIKEHIRSRFLSGIISENQQIQENGSITEIYKMILEELKKNLTNIGIYCYITYDIDKKPMLQLEGSVESMKYDIDHYIVHVDESSGDLILSAWSHDGGEPIETFDGMDYARNWDLNNKNYQDLDFSKIIQYFQTHKNDYKTNEEQSASGSQQPKVEEPWKSPLDKVRSRI